jgi:hypothetical protein
MSAAIEEKSTDTSARLDRVGATASLACAIHCALMPLVITLLPLVGLSFLADERIEWALVGSSAVLGISSLCLGRREHGSRRALAVLSVGLALLVLGRMMEQLHIGVWGVIIVVLGGVTVAGAHFLNRRLCQACRACNTNRAGE